MLNLTELLSQPTNVRLAVNKFLYKAGTNVALYNATRHPRYRRFQDKTEQTILEQIATFIDPAKITEIGFDTTPSLDIINKYFTSFGELYGDKQLSSIYVWAGTQGGQAGLDKLGIGKVQKAIEAKFVMRNQKMIAKLMDFKNLMIMSVDNTTKGWIADTIAAGKSEFFTNDEIARLLIEGGRDISKVRASLIAENEVAHAMAWSERQTYILNNVNRMVWVTSEDGTVCPICEENSNQEIDTYGTFFSGVSEPPAHPRCRCYTEPVFDNDFFMRQGNFFTGDDFDPGRLIG